MIRITTLLVFMSVYSLGQSWKGLNGGVNSTVSNMIIDSNNNLIVGGSFTEVNGNPQMGLAVWDSTSWTTFGNNANFSNFGGVHCMTFFNGDLIIGGHFDSINNVAVNNISRWDGTSWQPFGNGFNGDVQTVAVYNNHLYAGGVFFRSGQDIVRSFAEWNGSMWINAAPLIDGYVFSSLVLNGNLIIGGPFKRINGISYGSVAAWNDTSWSTVGNGFNNEVYNLATVDDTLYACGTFTQIPQTPCSFLAKYDGTSWIQMPYPAGTTNWTTDILKFHDQYFVCGNFNNPDDLGIINGSVYDSIGSTNGFILDMLVYKNQLYVGGNYSTIGNINTFCIARLDSFLVSDFQLPIMAHNVGFIYPTILSRSSFLNISKEKLNDNTLIDITVYNISGVKMAQFIPEQFPISMFSFSPSTYIIKFNYKDGKSSVQRFIVLP